MLTSGKGVVGKSGGGRLWELLRCPCCSAPLERRAGSWFCPSCAAAGAAEDGLFDLDVGGSALPQRLAAARGLLPELAGLLRRGALSPAEVRGEVFACLARAAERTRASLYSLLVPFFSNAGGAVVLVPPLVGTTSLVYASGWGALPRAISSLGGRAIGWDLVPEFVRYAALTRGSEHELYVRGTDPFRLPFAAATFDNVFAMGALEWVAEATYPEEEPRSLQRRLLAEFWRVLKPSGRLVLGVRNRWGIDGLGGRRDPFSGLRGVAPLPRRLADLLSRSAHGRPYRAYTHSRRGYAGLLRSARFTTPRCFVPWPDGASWSRLVASNGRPAANDIGHFGSSPKAKLVDRVVRSLRLLGVHEQLAPEFCLLASKTGSDEQSAHATELPRSIVECVLREEGTRLPEPLVIRSYPHSSMLAVLGDGRFVKFPLTEGASKRLWMEATALSGLGSHPVARYTLPPQVRTLRGVLYGVYPAFEIDTTRRTGEAEDKLQRIARALDLLGSSRVEKAICETEFWRRIFSAEIRRRLEALGAGSLLAHLEQRVAVKKAPAGIVHGDVHATNAFYDTEGEFRLIDWDRSQAPSPLVLDPTHAAHLYALQWYADGSSYEGKLGRALQMCLERAPGVPLLDRVESVLGELTWGEAWALHIIRWIADQVSSEDDILAYLRYSAMREPIEVCTQWLGVD